MMGQYQLLFEVQGVLYASPEGFYMKDLLSWLILFVMLVIMGIYLLGKLSDSQTNQIYARAHLVEVKSDANASWLTHVLPYFLTTTTVVSVVVVSVFAVVITLTVLVTGGLAIFGMLEYFGLRREAMARSAEQKQLGRPIIIQFVGTPRQVYKKLGADSDRSFIIDG